MTILGYVIVLVIGQFMLLPGLLVASAIGYSLAWASDRFRIQAVGFFPGVAGVMITVLAAKGVFRVLAGPGSFGWAPFLVALVPLIIPIHNDYRKARELRALEAGMPPRVAEYAGSQTIGMGMMPFGAMAGVLLSAAIWL